MLTLALMADKDKVSRFIGNMGTAVIHMQKALKILSLGLDYRFYHDFNSFTPFVSKTDSGYELNRHIVYDNFHSEICRPYFDFVIQSALRLQEGEIWR